MPCNDAYVYIDRSNNKARGLGYGDSYARPHGAPADAIYQQDKDDYKNLVSTRKKKIDFLTSRLCKILKENESETKFFDKYLRYDLSLNLWWGDHKKWDKIREQSENKSKNKSKSP